MSNLNFVFFCDLVTSEIIQLLIGKESFYQAIETVLASAEDACRNRYGSYSVICNLLANVLMEQFRRLSVTLCYVTCIPTFSFTFLLLWHAFCRVTNKRIWWWWWWWCFITIEQLMFHFINDTMHTSVLNTWLVGSFVVWATDSRRLSADVLLNYLSSLFAVLVGYTSSRLVASFND